MRVVVGVVIWSGLLVPLIAAPAADPTPDELIAAFEKKVSDISTSAGPSVACIVVARTDKYPKAAVQEHPGQLGGFDPMEFLRTDPTPTRAALANKLDLARRENISDHGTANGVVIDAGGLVLTTYGAIDGASKLYVHFPNGKGSYADIHAADSRSDLAVLRLLTPPPGLRAVPIGEARPDDVAGGSKRTIYPGKLIVLLAVTSGSGGEVRQPSAWVGSIATTSRRLDAQSTGNRSTWYNYGFVMEFQTVLRPQARGAVGASLGGNGIPLFTLDGEVIGFTTTLDAAANADPGPGRALPIDANARRIVDVLRRGQEVEYGFLGVVVGNGLNLISVTEQSPAWNGGLRAGDTITQINGYSVGQFDDLLLHAGTSLAGNKISLRVRGIGGQFRNAEVVLAKYKNESPYIASSRPEPVFGLRVDYSSMIAQTGRSLPQGVAVREVIANSPAAAKFKTLGDNPNRFVVTAVNGTRTPTPSDFYKASKGQATVKLTVLDVFDPNAQERDITIP